MAKDKGTGTGSAPISSTKPPPPSVESAINEKIVELEAVKGIVTIIGHLPKDSQERILTVAGETLDCWTKRTRKTKAEIAAATAAANGTSIPSTVGETPSPAPATTSTN